jgi:hypothetical protein
MRGLATMNSKTMEKWQAAKITEALFPATNYHVRLRDRMAKAGFPPDDELFRVSARISLTYAHFQLDDGSPFFIEVSHGHFNSGPVPPTALCTRAAFPAL